MRYDDMSGGAPIRNERMPNMAYPSLFPYMQGAGTGGNIGLMLLSNILGSAMGVNMGAILNRNVSPWESMMGMSYRQQMALAFNAPGKGGGGTLLYDQTKAAMAQYFKNQGQVLTDNELSKRAQQAVQMPMQMFPLLASVSPEFAKFLPQYGLTQGVMQGLQNMSGAGIIPAYGNLAREVTRHLDGPGMLAMGRRGELFSELGRRGMLPGRIEDLENRGTQTAAIKRITSRIKQYEELMPQLEDIFGRGKGIPELIENLDKALGGGFSGLSTNRLTNITSKMQSLQIAWGISGETIAATMGYSAQAARSMGMVGAVGAEAGLDALSLGQQMGEARNGYSYFGMRTPEELSGLYNKRILGFRSSEVSRNAGAVMDLIRTRLGAGAEGLTPAQMAARLPNGGRLAQMLKNLQTGTDPGQMSRDFQSGNLSRLADMLQSAGVIGDRQELYMHVRGTGTRGGQEMSSEWISAQTGLRAQALGAMDRNVAAPLNAVLHGKGTKEMLAKIKGYFGRGVDVSRGPDAIIAGLQKATGLDDTRARSVYNMVTGMFGADPSLEGMGGFEEVFGVAYADRAGGKKAMESDRIRGLNKMMQRATGGAKLPERIIKSLLGVTAKGDITDTMLQLFGQPTKEQTQLFTEMWSSMKDIGDLQARKRAGTITAPEMKKLTALEKAYAANAEKLTGTLGPEQQAALNAETTPEKVLRVEKAGEVTVKADTVNLVTSASDRTSTTSTKEFIDVEYRNAGDGSLAGVGTGVANSVHNRGTAAAAAGR